MTIGKPKPYIPLQAGIFVSSREDARALALAASKRR